MGQHLAKLLYLSALGGCSLIYNPSNLPDKGSMPPDAAVADANPALLHLDEVKSPVLLEGAGQDGSAPQVLVVYGGHITKTATVTLAPKTPDTNVMVTLENVSIADDGNSFAGTVKAAYMDMLDETGANMSPELPLVITVTQDGAPAPVTIDWAIKPLDELTTAGAQAAPVAGKMFSRVDVTGDVTFNAGPTKGVVRAVGRIKITGKVSANAAGQMPGAGGCAGGGGAAAGECFGAGKSGGGGGGFAGPGTAGNTGTAGPASGDPLVAAYDGVGAAMNKGGGGGGGASDAAGGGGGGVIELTAGGDVSVGSLEAKGADGVSSLLGRGGGGGAGGAIVLRSGAQLTLPTSVNITGASGGSGTIGLGPGGNGSVGRWRYDALTVMGTAPATPEPRRGPVFMRPTNPILETRDPTLMIVADPASGGSVDVVVQYPDETTETKQISLGGATSTIKPPMLQIGLNVVCVLVPGGNFVNDEAKSCIEVAFVP